MKTHAKKSTILAVMSALTLTGVSAQAGDPSERATRALTRNGEMICAFAHPTVTYRGARSWSKAQPGGGGVVTLEVHYNDPWTGGAGSTQIDFHFDHRGNIGRVGRCSKGIAFVGFELIRQLMIAAIEESPDFQRKLREEPATRATWGQVKKADAKSLLTFCLQLDQIGS